MIPFLFSSFILFSSPVEQQTTTLHLAQCMYAESTSNQVDHAAVGYSLKNWLRYRQKVSPELTFDALIQQYCAVHKFQKTKRQRKILSLKLPVDNVYTKPVSMDENSWPVVKKAWILAVDSAVKFLNGELRNPCSDNKKTVTHWGAKSYKPAKTGRNLSQINCGATSNVFYKIKNKKGN